MVTHEGEIMKTKIILLGILSFFGMILYGLHWLETNVGSGASIVVILTLIVSLMCFMAYRLGSRNTSEMIERGAMLAMTSQHQNDTWDAQKMRIFHSIWNDGKKFASKNQELIPSGSGSGQLFLGDSSGQNQLNVFNQEFEITGID